MFHSTRSQRAPEKMLGPGPKKRKQLFSFIFLMYYLLLYICFFFELQCLLNPRFIFYIINLHHIFGNLRFVKTVWIFCWGVLLGRFLSGGVKPLRSHRISDLAPKPGCSHWVFWCQPPVETHDWSISPKMEYIARVCSTNFTMGSFWGQKTDRFLKVPQLHNFTAQWKMSPPLRIPFALSSGTEDSRRFPSKTLSLEVSKIDPLGAKVLSASYLFLVWWCLVMVTWIWEYCLDVKTSGWSWRCQKGIFIYFLGPFWRIHHLSLRSCHVFNFEMWKVEPFHAAN